MLPYRNLVIHTSLNDINRDNHEKLDILVGKLDTKCKAIAQSYPKMKIYVSLLNKFNNLLETLVNCRSYIFGKITHMNLVNHEGVLADKKLELQQDMTDMPSHLLSSEDKKKLKILSQKQTKATNAYTAFRPIINFP